MAASAAVSALSLGLASGGGAANGVRWRGHTAAVDFCAAPSAAETMAAEPISSEGEDEISGSDGEMEQNALQHSLSLVGEGLTAVPSNLAAGMPALRRLCLHGNAIASLAGLSGLSALRHLNLSSNNISEVPAGALAGLGQLTALDLAGNSLRALPSTALAGLTRLRRLSLAHNCLTSLEGLAALHGGPLERLDVRDNALANLSELSVLAGLPHLVDLMAAGGSQGNQLCRQPQYRIAVAAVLPCLRLLDEQPCRPEEAMQYMAALQLQVFQPLPQPVDASQHTAQQQQQQQQRAQQQASHVLEPAATGITDASKLPCSQPPSQLAADDEGQQDGTADTTAAGQLQAIREAAALVVGSVPAARSRAKLETGEQWPKSTAGAPEQQLLQLLRNCPQLSEALRGALQQPTLPAAQQQLDQPSETQLTSTAVQTEPDASVAAAQEAAASHHDGLEQQASELQDEVTALQAELEAQEAAAQRAQHDAAVAAQQAQQQVAEVSRLASTQVAEAERKAVEAERKAAEALEQARNEVACLQARCEASEVELLNSRRAAAAGQLRQQELEYELSCAWQELDGSEAARRAEQQHTAAETERLAAALQGSRDKLDRTRCDLAAVHKEVMQQRQVADSLQLGSVAAGKESSKRQEELQQELAAAQAQAAELQQRAHEVAGREQEAGQQLRQLSSTLAAVHEEREAALVAVRQQMQRESQAAAAELQAAVAAAIAERDDLQRRLAATEAEFRCALQEAASESQDMRRDLEALAAECVGLRRALHGSQAQQQEAEGLAAELSEVVQQQKLRMRGLAQEKAEACARLQAMNPQELERLRGELLALRERAGELVAVRDQLGQERRLSESLQQRLAGSQQQLLEARQDAATRLAEAEAKRKAGSEEAARRVATVESAARESRARAEQLAEEVEKLRDAVKVKEVMVDSANERIADLKRAVAAAQAAADDALREAEEAEEQLRALQGGDADKQESLRAEVEVQEAAIDRLEGQLAEAQRRAGEAARRAAAAEAAAEEKEGIIAYVGEEVERVKALFEQKEARLMADRSSAQQEAAELAAERDRLAAASKKVEGEYLRLQQQLAEEQASARAAMAAAAQHRGQAARAAARVAEVEEELREVLSALEQHRASSAAKFAAVQNVLLAQDTHPHFM